MEKKKNSLAEQELNSLVESDLLYDFYGDLLTDHQKRIYEEVIFNDCSLSEVARDEGISRQGVSDLIRRVGEQLSEYERKLGLVGKFLRQRRDIREILNLAESFSRTKREADIDKIRALAEKLLSET